MLFKNSPFKAVIIGGFIFVVIANAVLIYSALSTSRPLMREDYYEAGVRYDSEISAGEDFIKDGLILSAENAPAFRLLLSGEIKKIALPFTISVSALHFANPSLDFTRTMLFTQTPAANITLLGGTELSGGAVKVRVIVSNQNSVRLAEWKN